MLTTFRSRIVSEIDEVDTLRKIFLWAAGLASVALAVAGTVPAHAMIDGGSVDEVGPNVTVDASGTGCTGTLINTQWVLSASAERCFSNGTTGTIEWGSTTRGKGTVVSFSKVVKDNGIALIQLDEELPADAVTFPSLGNADPEAGDTVQFFGFGSPELKTGSATVIEPSSMGYWTTRDSGSGTPELADWGGGAYLDGNLVGVTHGIADEFEARETNFAGIAAHRPFIDRTAFGVAPPAAPTPTP